MEREDITEKAPESSGLESRVLKHNKKSPAAQWNYKMLNALSHALKEDPEVDLHSALPSIYLESLSKLREDGPDLPENPSRPHFLRRDTRSLLKKSDPAIIVSPLSDGVKGILGENDNLSGTIVELLARSEILFRYPWGFSTMILRVSEAIAVKITRFIDNTTEYTSMQYLEAHKPSIPAPRPLGLVEMSNFYLIFMTFMPGCDLEEVWPQFEDHQKRDISCQLDVILSDLRSIPFPENQPLGGVQGEGCKDARRHIRYSSDPVMNIKDFEDFIFSDHDAPSAIYVNFLRNFSRSDQPTSSCVFTHGDLRPANIKVKQNKDGSWKVLGILDWEYSGFYPAYWEALKITNTLSSIGESDWYMYLPKCASPLQCPTRWLLDRVWDRNIR